MNSHLQVGLAPGADRDTWLDDGGVGGGIRPGARSLRCQLNRSHEILFALQGEFQYHISCAPT